MNFKFNPLYYLALGVVTIVMANMTFSVDLAGWIACIPFLLFLRNTEGVKYRLLFFAGLVTAWSICIAKIVSPPMPFVMVFLFSFPISLIQMPGYLVWDQFKDRPYALFLFPTVMMLMEWIQYTFTPFASWGVAAYTQSHTISVMQIVSLVGMPGLSFLIYWFNISFSEFWLSKKISSRSFFIPLTITVLCIVFGALRYDFSKAHGRETIQVAAVGSDSDVTGFPLPSKEINDQVKQNLFSRTAIAAQSGATLVVWNEASTFIMPDEVEAWRDSLSSLSKKWQVSLVAAFIVPLSESPARYRNQYFFFDAAGSLLYAYNKHQPVPGEPAAKGKETFEAFDLAGVKVGGVICYDYDFPYVARAFGDLHADLIADPSSDWRGIDPLHSRMAAFRAVEQGHSILRSTRFGMSAAITPYGEFAAQMSSYDQNQKVMMASLPAKRISTLYSLTGDVLVYLGAGFLIFFFVMTWRKKDIPASSSTISL